MKQASLLDQLFSEVEAIKRTPIHPDTISDVGETALCGLVSVVEQAVTEVYGQAPWPESESASLREDTALEVLGLGSVDELLDGIMLVDSKLDDIDTFIDSNLRHNNRVYVPTDNMASSIRTGSGEGFVTAETSERLKTVLFLVSSELKIDLNDPGQTVITEGEVDPGMVRDEAYVLIELPTINRCVLVCDQKGNVTYVFKTSELPKDLALSSLVDMRKTELNALLANNPSSGRRIVESKYYSERIVAALKDDIATQTVINLGVAAAKAAQTKTNHDSSFVNVGEQAEDAEKAPDGNVSETGMAKELGVTKGTIKRALQEIEPSVLGSVDMRRHGNKLTRSYTPEQKEIVRQHLDSKGLLTEKAPEGYLSANQFAEVLGIDPQTLRKYISEIQPEILGEVAKHKYYTRVVDSYSPKQQEVIREYLNERGLLYEPAPDENISLRGAAKLIKVNENTIKKYMGEIDSEELGAVKKQKFNGVVSFSFTPKQVEALSNHHELMKSKIEDAPEGWLSMKGLEALLGVSRRVIVKAIEEIGATKLGEVKRHRYNNVVVDSYSPEQQIIIKDHLDSQGKLAKPVSEGNLSTNGVANKFNVDRSTVERRLIDMDPDVFGEIAQEKFGGGVIADSFTLEQQDMIEAALKSPL